MMDEQITTVAVTSSISSSITPSTLRSSLDDPTVKAEFAAGTADNYITFLHPGYSDRTRPNILLRLQAFDRNGGGLHFGMALAACRIVAGNSENGFFTHQRDGPRIDLQYNELLRERIYYFYNPDIDNELYPVCKSFADWTFPHHNFPSEWSIITTDSGDDRAPPAASSLTAFLSVRDGRCRVSEKYGADYYTTAHLIPRSEKVWFFTNGMSKYNSNRLLPPNYILDDSRNAIALRGDIHLAFDDRKFVIVPKQSKWVIQFLAQTNSLGHNFHNTHISLKGVSAQFLYARFAWAIFPLLSDFLMAGVARQLIVRVPDGEPQSRLFTLGEIVAALMPTSRSASPRKRKLNEMEEEMSPQPSWSGMDVDLAQQDWVRKRRPSNPALYCCNYDEAESDARAGKPGKARWDGAYLCPQCLGVEYLEDRDKDVEAVSWDEGDAASGVE